jgi:hypothetical protein
VNLYKITALVEDAWDVEDDHQKRKRVIGYAIAGDGVSAGWLAGYLFARSNFDRGYQRGGFNGKVHVDFEKIDLTTAPEVFIIKHPDSRSPYCWDNAKKQWTPDKNCATMLKNNNLDEMPTYGKVEIKSS